MSAIKSSGILPGRLIIPPPTAYCSPGLGNYEDSPMNHGAYHWDCSDWAGRSHNPLPNITEVPGSEIPDSSSFHSNESNESNSKNHILPPCKFAKFAWTS
jgi:protocadherin Fat 1/2/3